MMLVSADLLLKAAHVPQFVSHQSLNAMKMLDLILLLNKLKKLNMMEIILLHSFLLQI